MSGLLTIEEIMRAICRWEFAYPVDHWRQNGLRMWPAIRLNLFDKLYQKSHDLGKTDRPGPLRSVLRYVQACAADYRNNAFVSSPKDILLFTRSTNRIPLLNAYYDRLSQPLCRRFVEQGLTYFTLEHVIDNIYLTPRNEPSQYFKLRHSLADARTFLQTRLQVRARLDSEPMEGHAEFQEELQRRYGITLLDAPYASLLIRSLAAHFEGILKTLKPIAAISGYYGNNAGMALNVACRSLGILSFDLQHGIEGDLHPAYGQWSKAPQDGYELLPDYFLVWSSDEQQSINRWNQVCAPRHRPLVIGNLLLQEWLTGEGEIVAHYDRELLDLKEKSGKAKHVLFTLGGPDLPAEFCLNAIERTQEHCQWWFRCHPKHPYVADRVKSLFRERGLERAYVDEAGRVPLYALLRHVDLHLTEVSSSVVEAYDFGISSVVVHESARRRYVDLIDQGAVEVALGEDDLVAAIGRQMVKRFPSVRDRGQGQALADRGLEHLFDLLLQRSRRTAEESSPIK